MKKDIDCARFDGALIKKMCTADLVGHQGSIVLGVYKIESKLQPLECFDAFFLLMIKSPKIIYHI